ncbi:MAG: UDP-N-acetylglucosamine 2-epimerase [Cycloclasticus sp.]
MIYCIIGTRAQLIKMAPIIVGIEKKSWPLRIIHTGQHIISMDDLRKDFSLQTPWEYLIKKSEAKTIFSSIKWLTNILYLVLFKAKILIPNASKEKDIVLVHGDTFSTVIGALLGKFSGASVAHIESGLRSFNVWNPFPEEVNRLITFRLSNKAFCPGDWAANNLSSYQNLEIINTHQNTLLDSLHIALEQINKAGKHEPKKPYGVVSIHRFENIYNKKRIQFIIDSVLLASKKTHLIFVLHPVTQKRLTKTGLLPLLTSNKNIELKPRTGYLEFIKLLAQSSFVITDGGSNQEELTYLKVPTLLMRKATERPEGLNKNVILSNYSTQITNDFLSSVKSKSENTLEIEYPEPSPTRIIINTLEQYRFEGIKRT